MFQLFGGLVSSIIIVNKSDLVNIFSKNMNIDKGPKLKTCLTKYFFCFLKILLHTLQCEQARCIMPILA